MQMTPTLFYFEVTGSEKVQAPGIVVQGTIKCRLHRTLSTEGSLAKLARGRLEILQDHWNFRIFTNAAEPTGSVSQSAMECLSLSCQTLHLSRSESNSVYKSQDVPTAISLHIVKPSSHLTKPQLISGFPHVILPRQAPSPSPSTPELSRFGSVLNPGSPSPAPLAGRDFLT